MTGMESPFHKYGGRLNGVAAKWSNAAVVAAPDGDFLLYYDGHEPAQAQRVKTGVLSASRS